MNLTDEQAEELRALAKVNKATGEASFLHHSHRDFYQPLADVGLVEIGPPPGTFDSSMFFGATITSAGLEAIASNP